MQDVKFPTAIIKDGTRGHDGLDEIRKKAFLSAMQGKVKNLLSVGNDAKTIKGEPYGVRTAVLYMAPANTSGFEICPRRTPGCSASCLFTAGQGRFQNVKQGRLRRTYQFLFRRDEFLATLVAEITRYSEKAENDGMVFAVRLNGTSDIAYEHYPVVAPNGERVANIFEAFPDIQFYDYTKIVGRAGQVASIPNYHMTFSRAETKANQADAQLALKKGINVTVVFRDKIPAMYMGRPVVSGELNDIRFEDMKMSDGSALYVGLLAKGDAIKEDKGFVVD